ncbi:cbb3-type cytochrome oxidase assembly protein CcoS [Acanthopleuribacter pedis]|uniref:Cbb3-type cytochrome oxidase assembly protein CcoS n=1 Tax=Acanthopleuribacter pedis TaxID=442870 RepID=A0A8J7Q6X1_9BACT|nr:cbb3-type cytochrome oxidase assembly protein CcoS [Acanthopleuribacter pedis]MBO1317899.1 cbb3-type cytochrome oxidase assembly protein CcoS [Acanthopleuribacter pedis]
MGILWVLVPLALALSGIAVVAYVWAWRNRQFEDMETPAYRVLFEDGEATRRGPRANGEVDKAKGHEARG